MTKKMTGEFGCSREATRQIAQALGMTEEEMRRSGLDLDVLDMARWVVERIESLGAPPLPPGFRKAVAIAVDALEISP